MRILKRIKNGARDVQKEFRERVATLILGVFGLVAALAWNEAIKTFFEIVFPQRSALIGKFVYAVVVTIIVVLLSLQLRKLLQTPEKGK